MPYALADVVPWGRSFDEYRRMFDLRPGDLAGRILGCADGPAAFNAQATRAGGRVVSCDPLYRFDRTAIAARIDAAFGTVMAETRRNAREFVWRAPEALARARRAAMDVFLVGYDAGRRAGRYVAAALPALGALAVRWGYGPGLAAMALVSFAALAASTAGSGGCPRRSTGASGSRRYASRQR
jgi:hypothetical protein